MYNVYNKKTRLKLKIRHILRNKNLSRDTVDCAGRWSIIPSDLRQNSV